MVQWSLIECFHKDVWISCSGGNRLSNRKNCWSACMGTSVSTQTGVHHRFIGEKAKMKKTMEKYFNVWPAGRRHWSAPECNPCWVSPASYRSESQQRGESLHSSSHSCDDSCNDSRPLEQLWTPAGLLLLAGPRDHIDIIKIQYDLKHRCRSNMDTMTVWDNLTLPAHFPWRWLALKCRRSSPTTPSPEVPHQPCWPFPVWTPSSQL